MSNGASLLAKTVHPDAERMCRGQQDFELLGGVIRTLVEQLRGDNAGDPPADRPSTG